MIHLSFERQRDIKNEGHKERQAVASHLLVHSARGHNTLAGSCGRPENEIHFRPAMTWSDPEESPAVSRLFISRKLGLGAGLDLHSRPSGMECELLDLHHILQDTVMLTPASVCLGDMHL